MLKNELVILVILLVKIISSKNHKVEILTSDFTSAV